MSHHVVNESLLRRRLGRAGLWLAALSLSVALHGPLVPLLEQRFSHVVGGSAAPADPRPQKAPAPLDDVAVDIEEELAAAAQDEPPDDEQTSVPEPAPRKRRRARHRPPDKPALTPAATEPRAAKPPAAGTTDPGAGPSTLEPNPNVRLVVHLASAREKSIADRISLLLGGAAEWRSFFASAGLDPLRDVDRLLVASSQLYDSHDALAIVEFNVQGQKLEQALKRVVASDSRGAWLRASLPLAQAHTAGNQRVFALPTPGTLVIAPVANRRGAENFPSTSRIAGPRYAEVVSLYLASPWQSLASVPIAIPKTLRSARLGLTPVEDGGLVLDVVVDDGSSAAAEADAPAMTRAVRDLMGAAAPLEGEFRTAGTQLRAEFKLNAAQADALFELLRSGLLG